MTRADLLRVVDGLESDEALYALERGLIEVGALDREVTLGGAGVRARIKQVPPSRLDDQRATQASAAADKILRRLFFHANLRVYLAFVTSLVGAMAMVALFGWAAWTAISRGDAGIGIKAVGGATSGVLSGTCFWLYGKEYDRLGKIQDALIRLAGARLAQRP